jgi:1-acyl-sn-glycerol-3-phosphate acyltransferase
MDANWWFRTIIFGFPLRFFFPASVNGRQNLPVTGPFILVAGSHTTWIESLLIAAWMSWLKIHFFAKNSYWKNPIIGWFMTATGQVPVNRRTRDIQGEIVSVGVTLIETAKRHHRRVAILFYPESTRNKIDNKVHAGGASAARIAIQTDVPLVPVGLIRMEKIVPVGAKWWHMRPFRRGVQINIGKPIAPWLPSDERPDGIVSKGIESVQARLLTERAMRAVAQLAGKEYSPTRLEIPSS